MTFHQERFEGDMSMGSGNCNGRQGFRAWGRGGRSLIPRLLVAALAVVTLLTGGYAPANATSGDILWLSTDPQPGKQKPNMSATDSQGNFIFAGYHNLVGGVNDDFYVVKVKADGSGPAWRGLLDYRGGEDRALGVAVDGNRDVIATGYVWNGSNRDIYTVKYNGTTGAVLWQHVFPGAAGGNDVGMAVAVDSGNNVYVAGNSQSGTGDDDIIILKYGPDGPQANLPIWQATFAGSAGGIDQANFISAASDGVVITGKTWNGTAFDMITVKYGFDSTLVWQKPYSTGTGAGNGCIGNEVKVDASGNVVAIGSAANGSNLDIYTVKYNGANGDILWQRTFDGGFDDEPLGMVTDTAGDVYVTGYTFTLNGANDFFTTRYSSANGSTVWQQVFNSGDTNTDAAVPTGIILEEPNGHVFVTGYTITAGNYDFRTIKYKRDNGNLLWQQYYNGPASGNDRPIGIGLSPAGDVIVGGWTDTVANDFDLLVIKYDKGLLDPPTSLVASTLTNTSIQLTWTDNSLNEELFKIERRLGETGTWEQIATVGQNVTAYTDNTVIPDNVFYYRVRAYNAANQNSLYSNVAHALTFVVSFTGPTWSYIYNNADNTDDYATAIAVGPDNDPVVTGYSNRNIGTFDYYTLKLNRTSKSVLWSDQYDDTDSEVDQAKCLAVDWNNNVLVSGFSQLYYAPARSNINSIYTIKYPSAGPPETWHGQYNGPGAIDDRATAIATTVDGFNNTVVVGYGKNSGNNDDVYVLKYPANPTLNEQGGAIPAWAATPFDGGGDDIPSAVAVAPDGSVYVTGVSERGVNTNIYNMYTAKYDGATGARIWADVYSVTAGGDNRGKSIAVDAYGDVYVTGSARNGAGNLDIHTIKYRGSANTVDRIWERSMDGAAHGDDEGATVRVDPIDGAIVVAGTVLTAAGDRDVSVIRYSSGGDLLWQRTLLRHDLDDVTTAMAMDSSGYVYVSGTSSNGSTSDIISIIYDGEGYLLGAVTYNGPGNSFDESSSIAVNYKGEAFIAGYTKNSSGNADYVVLKQVNNFLLVPAPFAATPQADSTKINLSWGSNTAGTSFLIERTLGPINALSVWEQIATPAAGVTSYLDPGRNANTMYCYRITAISGSLSSRKLLSCTTTTPVAPTLGALSLISATAIDLSWSNVAGNTGYKVERSADNATWTQVGGDQPANTTVFHDTGLPDGAVQYYRVSALSNSGPSLASTVQIAPALNAPTGVTHTKIDLSWPPVTGITGYILERSTDNATWTQLGTFGVGTTTYSNNSGLTPATTYYYRLKVTTATGTSVPSLVRSATTILAAPTLSLAAGTTTSAINLSWNNVTGATGFTIWESTCNYNGTNQDSSCSTINNYWWGGWAQVGSTGEGVTAFSRTGRPAGYSHQYYVVATAGSGSILSPNSNAVLAWTLPAAPVIGTISAPSDTTVNLYWTDVAGDAGYILERKTGEAGTWAQLATPPQGYNAWTDSSAVANTLYYYRLRAKGMVTGTYSDYSPERYITTPPTGPTVSTVSATSTATVTWGTVPGATGYQIRRSVFGYYDRPDLAGNPAYASSWGAWSGSIGTSATASFTDTGTTAGYTYRYSVLATFDGGSATGWGSDGGKYVTTIPPVPGNFTNTGLSGTQIRLNWANVYGELNYSVRYKIRSAADCASEDWGTGVTTTPAIARDSLTTTIGSLATTNAYCFQLSAYNNSGSSAWTSALTYLPPPTLGVPTGITQSAATLTWSAVTGNSGYRIERSSDNVTFNTLTAKSTGVTTHTDTTLTAGNTYYYRVLTLNGSSVSAPGNVQSATALAPSAPMLDPITSKTSTQITLTWSDVPGNYGYKVEQSLNGSTWTAINYPVQGAVTWTSPGLTPGTTYYYRVSTKTGSGSFTAPSNVQSAMTLLSTPSLTLTGATASSVDMKWQVITGATNYRLLRSVGPDGPWSEVNNAAVGYTVSYCGSTIRSVGCQALVADWSVYTDPGLTADLTYCYQLKAWNSTVGDSLPSTTVCRKTQSVAAPVITTATASGSQKISLQWSYNPGSCTPVACSAPEGFEIWRQLVSGDWAAITTVGNVSTYTDKMLIEPNRQYSYKVRAVHGSDRSAFSAVRDVTTPTYSTNDTTCP